MDDKIENLYKSLNSLSEDFVKSDEFIEVFQALLSTLQNVKDESDTNLNSVISASQKKFEVIQSQYKRIQSNIDSVSSEKDEKVSNLKTEILALIKNLKSSVEKEIKSAVNSIPEPKEITPKEIRDSLLTLKGNDLLPLSIIEGSEKLVNKGTFETAITELGGKVQLIEKRNSKGYGALGGGSEGTGSSFLTRLRDVNLSGLTKDSDGKYMLGSGGSSSPLTTKGDLYTYSTTNARLGVGTDNQVFIANSAATTGNSWSDVKTINGTSLIGSGNIVIDATVTLADLSANSTTTPTSLYTMTSTIPVEFRSSDGNPLLYLDETNERVGVGTASPAGKLDVNGTSFFRGNLTVTGANFITKPGPGTGTYNEYFGFDSGGFNTTGFRNAAAGNQALYANTSGYWNTGVGFQALAANTDGYENTAVGTASQSVSTSGFKNTSLGIYTLAVNTTGYGNVAVGSNALQANETGSVNVAVGASAGYSNVSGAYSVFLGYQAGYYETVGNKLYIDDRKRTDEADGRVKSLIYGFFDDAVANQFVRINGNLQVTSTGNSYFNGNVGIGTSTPGAHLQLGTAFNGYTPSGTLDFAVGSTTLPSRFFFGQSLTTYGGMVWNYNATPANAYLSIGAGSAGPAPTYITPTLNILQSGNVGIGTTSPSYLLQIQKDQNSPTTTITRNDTSGTSAASQFTASYGNFTSFGSLRQQNPSYTTDGLLVASSVAVLSNGNANGLRVLTYDATSLTFGTNNTSRWVINSSGHFLSGTDNSYDIGASGATRPRTGYFGTSLIAPVGTFATSVNTQTYYVNGDSSAGVISYGGDGFVIRASASTKLSLGAGGLTNQLVIDVGGNVGIGTITPAYTLDVLGDLHVGDGNNFNPLIQYAGSGRVAGSPGYSFLGDLDTGMYHPNALNTIAFSTGGVEAMRIDGSGNVGVGTASPSATFHVVGINANITATDDSSIIELLAQSADTTLNAGVTLAPDSITFNTTGGITFVADQNDISITTNHGNFDMIAADGTMTHSASGDYQITSSAGDIRLLMDAGSLIINTGGTNNAIISADSIASSDKTFTLPNRSGEIALVSKRVVTTTDDATAVIDVAVTDVYELSAIANNTTFSTTGTPTDGQSIIIRWKDAGVSKTLTWDPIFVAVGITLPTSTTAGKWQYVGATYNAAASKFHAIALSTQA